MIRSELAHLDVLPSMSPNGLRSWVWRLCAAGVALLLGAGAFHALVPQPSWARNGFARNPGDFVRKLAISYPVCVPWQGGTDGAPGLAADHASPAVNVTRQVLTRTAGYDGISRTAILLPKTADVLRVYCGVAAAGAAPQECSPDHCNPAIHARYSDDLYTRGRGLQVFARNPAKHTYFWVVWRK